MMSPSLMNTVPTSRSMTLALCCPALLDHCYLLHPVCIKAFHCDTASPVSQRECPCHAFCTRQPFKDCMHAQIHKHAARGHARLKATCATRALIASLHSAVVCSAVCALCGRVFCGRAFCYVFCGAFCCCVFCGAFCHVFCRVFCYVFCYVFCGQFCHVFCDVFCCALCCASLLSATHAPDLC